MDTTTPRNPMQPIVKVGEVCRFKRNAIVDYLYEQGQIKMNELATVQVEERRFTQDDWEQFYQLIGYSIAGFHELSLVSDQTAKEASELAAKTFGAGEYGCRDSNCGIHLGIERQEIAAFPVWEGDEE